MAKYLELQTTRTYASIHNAIKAVERVFPEGTYDNLTYIVTRTEDGRYYPIFIGERAIQAMAHFHFHVVA